MNTPAVDALTCMSSNPDQPLISVVMGVYNAEATIAAALESILNQSETRFEVVLVDDGSTDSTADLIDRFATADSRIRIIRKENEGLTKALIVGCQRSRGEFILRHDADDVSLPTRFQLQLAALKEDPQAVLATSRVEDRLVDGTLLAIHQSTPQTVCCDTGVKIKYAGVPAHGSVLMRRSAYEAAGGYRAPFYYAQDADLWLRLSRLGSFVEVPEVLYQRTVSTTCISSRHSKAQAEFCRLARRSIGEKSAGMSDEQTLRAAEELVLRCRLDRNRKTSKRSEVDGLLLIALALKDSNPRKAMGMVSQAIVARPLNPRSWASLARVAFACIRRKTSVSRPK